MGLKLQFGNRFTRFLNGGVTLYPAEYALLDAAVAALPPELRGVVEAQFDAYNLVQREIDGRALNFYRKERGAVQHESLPLLSLKSKEAPLIRFTARISGSPAPVHAVLTAVAGRAFCLTMDRALESHELQKSVLVDHVVQAWRSNFESRTEI